MHPTLTRPALLITAVIAAACGTTNAPPTPAPAASARPALTAGAFATDPPATPLATALAGTPALGLPLPPDSAPIDVAYAFDSIWVAAHHTNQVYRVDPATMEIIARIQVGSGPGWFAVTDDALWVSNQMSRGMTRIDPKTNSGIARAGMWPPCGAPLVALGKIWQMACDAHQLMSIDPVTNNVTDVTVTDFQWPAFVDGQIVMSSDAGLARIDPETGDATTIPAPGGFLTGYDEKTVWLSDQQVVRRVETATGKVVATLPVTYGGMVRSYGDHAWMVQESTAVMRIDTATNEITKTIPLLYGPIVAIEAAGYVWVTAYDGNMLWRLEP